MRETDWLDFSVREVMPVPRKRIRLCVRVIKVKLTSEMVILCYQ